jgi:electron transfer flavoprotein beta subunit
VNIIVLVKQVPDTATQIQDRVRDGGIDLDGVTWVANPYDEFAVEEALRLKEKHGATVTLVSLGPDRVDSALKDMLALGADEAVHVKDSSFEGLDARGTAVVLAAAVGRLPHDMIWTGWKGVDNDEGLVPLYLAKELGVPYVSAVQEFAVDGSKATVSRDIEGARETLDVALPAIFGAQKGLNEVRYASLKGIMAVKRKQIPTWDAAELGIDAASLPAGDVEVVAIEPPPGRAAGRIIEGTPQEAASELARLLREEAKVI